MYRIILAKKNWPAEWNILEPEEFHGVAIGTVDLWGTVIEHEDGYRAEYAQVQSIDRLLHVPQPESTWLLEHLRALYGV
jgi:hypothetical protein